MPFARPRFSLQTRTVAVLALAALAGACGHMQGGGGARAQADLTPTRGNTTAGVVRFHAHGPAEAMVHLRITGLKPGQEHGFHIHEKGDCSSGDGMSTGGHFNPLGKKHGQSPDERHAGDMPALKADANGVADTRFMLHGVSIGSGETDIVGKGLIVHAMPDDYKTQPTGNSGARIACAVITLKN